MEAFEIEDFFDELVEVGEAGDFGAYGVHDETGWFPFVMAFTVVLDGKFFDKIVGDVEFVAAGDGAFGVEIGG